MSFIPKPQEIYKHFKGNLYQIVAVAEHSETGERLVVYQAMYGEFKTYARPLAMFTERLDRSEYPDAAQEFRFELQGADRERQTRESESPAAGGLNMASAGVCEASGGEPEEIPLHPLVLEFLDADTYRQKLNILAGLHYCITDSMITTMAIACDIEVEDGDLEDRYESLRNCLLTMERYECNRLS